MQYKILDQKAKRVASDYKRCEKQLVAVIAAIDQAKAFYKLGHKSLFSYMTEGLELSPAVASNISTVVRKSYQVPALKEKVIKGEISLCKARRIAPVIDQSNQNRWFEVAQEKTQRQIEREVAIASPQHAIQERVSYLEVTDQQVYGPLQLDVVRETYSTTEKITIKQKIPRIKLELGLSEKLMLKIRRCQDLESQRKKDSINLESCLDAMAESYLTKHDPVRKAERQRSRGQLPAPIEIQNSTETEKNDATASVSRQISESTVKCTTTGEPKNLEKAMPKRTAIPGAVKHKVQLRDQGQCTYVDNRGRRCSATRFVEFHHILPVSQGGTNLVDNLQLLCSGHHKMHHMNSQ